MKKLFLVIISLAFIFAFSNISFAQNRGGMHQGDQGYGMGMHQGQNYKGGHGYEHHDYKGYRGYNERGDWHHSNEFRHHYPNYRYYGHWNNWNDWEDYCRRYPEFREHGHYENYMGHMYFMFNDGMFAFSIGN